MNNNLINLRWVSHQENSQNKSMSKNNTSGTKGINWHRQNKKWQVRIAINGKQKHIGFFRKKTMQRKQDKKPQKYIMVSILIFVNYKHYNNINKGVITIILFKIIFIMKLIIKSLIKVINIFFIIVYNNDV